MASIGHCKQLKMAFFTILLLSIFSSSSPPEISYWLSHPCNTPASTILLAHYLSLPIISSFFFFKFLKNIVLVSFYRGTGREKERERNISVWLLLTCPLLGTWPTTQACALTENQTNNPLVCRPVHIPLSHTSQRTISPF